MAEEVILEVKKGVVITRLSPLNDFSSFDCGDTDINEFLKDDALPHIEKDLAVVYIIKDENNKVLAYSTLSMSTIKLKHRGDVPYPQVPAILLGRLGVNKESKFDDDGNKNYYGYELIDFCTLTAFNLKNEVGCCYLIVDSYPDMVEYYTKKGFETEKSEKDIRKNKEKKERERKFRNIPMYFKLDMES